MALGAPYLVVGGAAAGPAASTAFTVAHTTALGDAIAVWATTNTGSVSSITDSQSNVYVPQTEVTSSSLHGQWFISYNSKKLTAGTDTITITPVSNSATRTVSAFGCSGVGVAAAADYQAAKTASGTSVSPSVTSGALVWKDELSLAGLVNGNGGGPVTWTGTFATGAITDTQHSGTTEYGAAGAIVTAVSPWPSTATVTAAGTIVSAGWGMSLVTLRAQTSIMGASIGSPGSFFPGTPTMTQAIAEFDGWVGRTMASKAVRAYYTAGSWPGSLSSTQLGWIAAGLKIIVSFKPGGSTRTLSTSEATNLANAIKMWQNAGANFDAILWHEPNTTSSGFTISEYAAYVAYYAPTVRGTSAQAVTAGIAPTALGYVPMLGTGGGGTAYSFYPGDQYVDWMGVDFYGSAYHSGVRMDSAQSGDAHSILWRADNHAPTQVPMGVYEWNAGAGTQISLAEWNGYVQHLTTIFTGRVAAGKVNADIVFWMGNSSGCQDQIINSTDFKIPGPGPNACATPNYSNPTGFGLQTFYDALYPPAGGGGGGGTGGGGSVPPLITPGPPASLRPASWAWLIGQAAPHAAYITELSQARARSLRLRAPADAFHEASFLIDGRHPEAASFTELSSDLTVMRDGAFLFRGRIAPTSDSIDGFRHDVQVTAMDYRELLRRRMIFSGDTKDWTSTEQFDICWSILNATQGRAGGDLGIAKGAGKSGTGVTRTVSFAAGDMIGDKISEMGQTTSGFDWFINSYAADDLRFDLFYPYTGADRGIVLEFGAGLVAGMQRQVDPSTFANSIYLTGDSSKSLTPIQEDAAGIGTAAQGRFDQVVGTNIKTSTYLQARADWYLADAQVVMPSYIVNLYPGAWNGPDHIWIGDTVRLRIRSGRLDVDAPYRVLEIAVELGESNEERITLTIGRIPQDLRKLVPRMLRRLRDLDLR